MMYLTKIEKAPVWMQNLAKALHDEPKFVAVYSETFLKISELDLAAALRGLKGDLEANVTEAYHDGAYLYRNYGADVVGAQFTTEYAIYVV